MFKIVASVIVLMSGQTAPLATLEFTNNRVSFDSKNACEEFLHTDDFKIMRQELVEFVFNIVGDNIPTPDVTIEPACRELEQEPSQKERSI